MEAHEILRQLQQRTGTLPRPALEVAIAQRAAIVDDLLQILAQPREHAEAGRAEPQARAHIYALFLLAQCREPRAYPVIVDFFSLPGELVFDLTGEVVTEDLKRILASVCGGDLRGIRQLVEQPIINAYVRNAAFRALVCVVACGEKTRDEVVAYYAELFHGRLVHASTLVWGGLVSCCTDLRATELSDEIHEVFGTGVIDAQDIGLRCVEKELARGPEVALAELARSRYRLIDDTIAELQHWVCFQPLPARQLSGRSLPARTVGAGPPPARGAVPKVGRNAPCPGGSGNKYKKCCGHA